jgi:hypothetical protein
VQFRSYSAGANVLGIERNKDKRTVIEVPIFVNGWLEASEIAGCSIGLIQFLSLGDDYFFKMKNV